MTPRNNELIFCALGGSGEIGMNVTLYGHAGKWLMIDCGVTFADGAYPGIDLILPDLRFIEERGEDLVGIVITHGHEDHIGALPYLAEDLGVPLYATPFTAGLIRGKLEEERIEDRVKLKLVAAGKPFKVGPFTLEMVPLSHSIPEANGLLIECPSARVFHTGDWKLDDNPVIGKPVDAKLMQSIGDRGVDVLVCDSTNVFNLEASGSEASVYDGILETVHKAKGRVVVTTFASNAARLSTLGRVAKETGRAICVTGRSLDRILRVARATG
ncbi:ribonuclease J, partial [Sphingomonas sp. Leaf412]|uniref:ribonuclease J n=1 Tax=Sphingomonas sp. Leaf412 TaxID=1736370 RepID=UPI001F3D1066